MLQKWKHPPFGGVIADGFLWGRGALDNKSNLVSILEAAESLLQAGFTPKRTMYLKKLISWVLKFLD